jgi:hypothetical protein
MSKKKLRARLWLLAVLVVLAAGNYLLFLFSFHELNPYPITRGIAFGSSLWSLALIIAMWLRMGWARYVLATWLVLAIVLQGLFILRMNSQSVKPLPEPTKIALIGLGLYALALIPLGASRSLRGFLGPKTAGGH